MEVSNEKPVRKGLHKYVHVSKLDTYVYTVFSLSFLVLVVVKVFNRVFDLGMATPYITWVDALQIAILWAVLAFVSDAYFMKYEKKYEKFL